MSMTIDAQKNKIWERGRPARILKISATLKLCLAVFFYTSIPSEQIWLEFIPYRRYKQIRRVCRMS